MAALLGVYQEWPGPWRRVAGVGDGGAQGGEPFRCQGEVRPLPEGSVGPQPAQHGFLTAAGGGPAPGDHSAAHSGHGKKICLYLTSFSAAVVVMLLSLVSIIAQAEAEGCVMHDATL